MSNTHPSPEATDPREAEAGMRWWNALTEPQRAAALAAAKTATPAEAWAHFRAPANPERAWLAGTTWLACLTMDERSNVFRTFGAALPVPADDMTLAGVVAKIAGEVRAHGPAQLASAADRLDGIAEVLASPENDEPTAWTPNAERVSLAVEATWQIADLARMLGKGLREQETDGTSGMESMAIRVLHLNSAIMSLIGDRVAKPGEACWMVRGRTLGQEEGALL